MVFLFYLVKVQTEPNVCTFHVMSFRELRVRYTTERIASDNFSLCIIKKKEVPPLSKYSQSSPAQTRIIFPESSL